MMFVKKSKPYRNYKAGVLNKTERQYADYLNSQKMAGLVVSYQFEALKLKLAKNTTYTPDFLVVTEECVELQASQANLITRWMMRK